MNRSLLFAQIATTLPLVGLIWFVQIVAYPLFARVGSGEFQAYHALHSRLIVGIVGPLMLIELLASCAWVFEPSYGVRHTTAMIGAALTLSTWAFTMFFSIPAHNALAGGFDERVHASLVNTNWLRTIAWSARGALLLWTLSRQP